MKHQKGFEKRGSEQMKNRKTRNQIGAMAVTVSIVSFMVLLPLGLLAFEVSRLFLAQAQLRNAVDAAALGAVSAMTSSDIAGAGQTDAQIESNIKALALKYFQKNVVISNLLASAVHSSTVDTDNPEEGKATFDLAVDQTNGKVIAKAAFGLKPAFSEFLGLGTSTIRANATGAFKGLTGDVVVLVDISDSMTLGTGLNGPGTFIIGRKFDKNAETGYKLSYPIRRETSRTPPALGCVGNYLRAIPNPELVDFAKIPAWSFLQNAPKEVKIAALFEAKRGNLNSQEAFIKGKVNQGPLGDLNTQWGQQIKAQMAAGVDFKAAYQEAALPFVHPLADAKKDAANFVSKLTAGNPDVHVGLVGFAPYAGGNKKRGNYAEGQDKFDSYAQSVKKQSIPVVRLDQASSKSTDALKAIETCTTFEGTNTTDGLRVAKDMLTGNGARAGVPKTIILLTDGVPTSGGYKRAAKECGEAGIKILAIGFFHTGYAAKAGPRATRKIVAACGNGSKYFSANFQQEEGSKKKNKGFYPGSELDDLKVAFDLIARGEPALVNN